MVFTVSSILAIFKIPLNLIQNLTYIYRPTDVVV